MKLTEDQRKVKERLSKTTKRRHGCQPPFGAAQVFAIICFLLTPINSVLLHSNYIHQLAIKVYINHLLLDTLYNLYLSNINSTYIAGG